MIARDQHEILEKKVTRRGRRFRRPVMIALGMALIYGLGFAFFVADLPAPYAAAAATADGIVALTGEGGRLAPAVTLLEAGHGKRLLITGVNRLTSKRDLKALLHGGESFDCCADLGFAAQDTHGNAEEAALWAREHHYGSLIVVTANYHMPRSMVEFGARMPGVKLMPYPVVGEAPETLSWQSARRLNAEYLKYLASLVRTSIAGMFAHA